jgi:hypothetical protein
VDDWLSRNVEFVLFAAKLSIVVGYLERYSQLLKIKFNLSVRSRNGYYGERWNQDMGGELTW